MIEEAAEAAEGFADVGAVVLDESFPEADLALRRGRHIDRDDGALYNFLLDAQTHLEPFYRRFGCELVHKSDGYFYLLPTSDRLGRRQLSVPEMLVGQALALLYLDPTTVQSGGVVTRDDVLGHMASVMGTDGLMAAFNPKKKRLDERVAQETVRSRVAEGLRKLTSGGFIEALEGEAFRLRSALMRFAEPVRTADAPAEALRKLVAKGEVVLEETDAESTSADAESLVDDVHAEDAFTEDDAPDSDVEPQGEDVLPADADFDSEADTLAVDVELDGDGVGEDAFAGDADTASDGADALLVDTEADDVEADDTEPDDTEPDDTEPDDDVALDADGSASEPSQESTVAPVEDAAHHEDDPAT